MENEMETEILSGYMGIYYPNNGESNGKAKGNWACTGVYKGIV